MVVTADLAAFVRRGVAIVVATRDEERRPAVARAWGPTVSDDGTTAMLCVAAAPGSPTLANLEANGAVAVTFSLPTTYRGVQMKGDVVDLGAPGAEHLARVEEHVAAFGVEVEPLGIPRDAVRRFLDAELVAVSFAVRELYDQTPGPTAGGRLGPSRWRSSRSAPACRV
jgi:hypothetical protein